SRFSLDCARQARGSGSGPPSTRGRRSFAILRLVFTRPRSDGPPSLPGGASTIYQISSNEAEGGPRPHSIRHAGYLVKQSARSLGARVAGTGRNLARLRHGDGVGS